MTDKFLTLLWNPAISSSRHYQPTQFIMWISLLTWSVDRSNC